MRVPDAVGLGMLAVLAATPALAQSHGALDTVGGDADFLARARDGSAAYRNRAAAIADGFRAMGPDAPAMGQHWVHPGRVLSGVFDPARPAGLTYIMFDGRPTLAGVVYVLPLQPGAQPPAEPAGADAWHFHNGDLSEEAVLSVHDPRRGRDGPGLRIAVLHAWVWAENPRGAFTPENWALPYTRLGLPTPDVTAVAAAKAASLATAEGRAFFASRVHLVTSRLVADVERLLLVQGDRIRVRLPAPGAPSLTPADLAWLERSWQAVVSELVAVAAPEEGARVREVLDPSSP